MSVLGLDPEFSVPCDCPKCDWGYASLPPEGRQPDPPCRCGKPGAWRGATEGTMTAQVMRCSDCCAADAVAAAVKRDAPVVPPIKVFDQNGRLIGTCTGWSINELPQKPFVLGRPDASELEVDEGEVAVIELQGWKESWA